MTKILNTTTLTFLQETTFIFYTIAFGWIIYCGLRIPGILIVTHGANIQSSALQAELKHRMNEIYIITVDTAVVDIYRH